MQCFIILQYLSLNEQLYNYSTYSYVAIYRNIIISVDYQNKNTDMHGIYIAIAMAIIANGL